ncbi:MAG TPA: DUF1573 domain-containing protein [Thermoanaerobaculia bacterium]|nr:DUF1573 domain-containing protein [Thermoanaerobaculia bacterium]
MSDDFGTVHVRRGERAREIEVLRQHYRQHREALVRMTADAPTEHLATEYQRLIAEIDRALGKLDELEGAGAAPPPAAAAAPPPPPPPRIPPPAERPLAAAPRHDLPEADEAPQSRMTLMIAAAVLALAVIAGLVWWASRDGQDAGNTVVVEDTAGTAAAPVSTTPDTIEAAAPAASGLAATPASHDYGELRKGTRAVREFEIANNTDEPISVQVARSACRCLYYAHAPVIPPRAKESLSVTIDGARAKAGPLREAIRISAKSDPGVATSVDVIATIR